MEKSENITNLASALVEVQKTDLFALTDKNNPFFNSKYADLSSVWSAARKPLTENNLSIVQTTDVSDNGVVIETMLMHTSGEYITGRLLIRPEKSTPQGVGSAITYGRRYALAAIIGISPEDDDGEAAMDRKILQKKEAADKLIEELRKTTSIPHKDNWKKKYAEEINALDKENRARVIKAGEEHTKKLKEAFKNKQNEKVAFAEQLFKIDKTMYDNIMKTLGIDKLETTEDYEKFLVVHGEINLEETTQQQHQLGD